MYLQMNLTFKVTIYEVLHLQRKSEFNPIILPLYNPFDGYLNRKAIVCSSFSSLFLLPPTHKTIETIKIIAGLVGEKVI